jgi:hypothetical protein
MYYFIFIMTERWLKDCFALSSMARLLSEEINLIKSKFKGECSGGSEGN